MTLEQEAIEFANDEINGITAPWDSAYKAYLAGRRKNAEEVEALKAKVREVCEKYQSPWEDGYVTAVRILAILGDK